MEAREAFAAIETKLRADPRTNVVETFFDDHTFGNFSISYEQRGERLSVVHDRGQLILYDGTAGDHFRTMLVSDLRGADEQAVLDAVS